MRASSSASRRESAPQSGEPGKVRSRSARATPGTPAVSLRSSAAISRSSAGEGTDELDAEVEMRPGRPRPWTDRGPGDLLERARESRAVPRIGETAAIHGAQQADRPHTSAGDQLSTDVMARLRQHEHPHAEDELHERRRAKQHKAPTRPLQQRPDTDRLSDHDRTDLIGGRACPTLQPHKRVISTQGHDLRRPV